jgi:hypothetical protein
MQHEQDRDDAENYHYNLPILVSGMVNVVPLLLHIPENLVTSLVFHDCLPPQALLFGRIHPTDQPLITAAVENWPELPTRAGRYDGSEQRKMHSDTKVIEGLAEWFTSDMRRIRERDLGDQCELLLCASDLGIDTPRIRQVISAIGAGEPDVSLQDDRLLDSTRRQLVFLRYAFAVESRKRFLDYWVNQARFRGKDVFSVSLFINLALEQQQYLTPERMDYVRKWHLKHHEIHALRVRAWAPHALNLAGFRSEAKDRADEVLASRQTDGSWDHDVRRTLGTVYPLLLCGHIEDSLLSPCLEYAMARIARGIADDLAVKATALKVFHRLGEIPEAALGAIRHKLVKQGGIFLSHTSADKPAVRKLAEDLRSAGVHVWIDEAEIRPGDSLFDRIEAGINDMEYLGVVLSPRSVESPWVQKELNMALVSALSVRAIRVIPLLFESCSIPLRVRDIKWIDFRPDYQRGLEELLRALETP